MFVLKRANTACRQQMTTRKLFHKHFNQLQYDVFSNWYYISTELLSVTKPSITYQQIERIFCRYSMAFTGIHCRFAICYESLLLKEHLPRNQGG